MARNGENEPSIVLVNSTINVCNLQKGLVGNFLARTVFQLNHKNTNLTVKCPFVKGIYHLTNLPITDEYMPKQLLGFLPDEVNGTYYQTVYIKMIKNKPMIKVCELKVLGSYIKNN